MCPGCNNDYQETDKKGSVPGPVSRINPVDTEKKQQIDDDQ